MKKGSSCRHLVGIARVVAVVFTDREQIIGPNTAIIGVIILKIGTHE